MFSFEAKIQKGVILSFKQWMYYLCCNYSIGVKKLLAYIALAGILMQFGSKLFIVAGFILQRDYISQELCEKKDIPGNCCLGSCQLKKQLAEDETEKVPAGSVREIHELLLFHESSMIRLTMIVHTVKQHFFFKDKFYNDPSFSIFHPPRV